MSPHIVPTSSHKEPSSTPPRVLTILSHVLDKLVTRNDRFAGHGSVAASRIGAFNGVRAPAISLAKYVERIFKYTSCSPSCFVVGFVYIDRLVHRYPEALVVSLNVHRLLVTSVMVASKILDDVHNDNAFYARVGGVTNAELNKLELELLFLLDFDLYVSPRVFESYCQHLEKQMLCNGELMLEKPITMIINNVNDVAEISNHDAEEEDQEEITQSSSSTHFVECSS